MNKLEKNSVQFDYFSSNYQKFEEDFYAYANMNIPLTFLADDILKMMFSTGRTYFRPNAPNAKDKRDHFFLLVNCNSKCPLFQKKFAIPNLYNFIVLKNINNQ